MSDITLTKLNENLLVNICGGSSIAAPEQTPVPLPCPEPVLDDKITLPFKPKMLG
ncbi:hypothetical protein [Alteromonas lipolytica]|uniref:hypothetical protein n=1 Tax=Alteromonas lipolytica TaxID=1856405 RepID=UPI001586873E|nr:hypothetical protein [Alteromonas lipolytica]GGF66849.1 hypothetical protein GCM10011338_18770 [Alteromonas lipolytica]